jgi:hypothetical protein
MGVAANRFAAIAIVGQKLGLVANSNLPHLNSGLKLGSQKPDQFSKVDAVLSQVINNNPLEAK